MSNVKAYDPAKANPGKFSRNTTTDRANQAAKDRQEAQAAQQARADKQKALTTAKQSVKGAVAGELGKSSGLGDLMKGLGGSISTKA
ncbi:MAG: hypothetical protein HY751_12000 [Nitrospinae bacterium]|nr:hypothetical protein [Nitrospinota bacterium]